MLPDGNGLDLLPILKSSDNRSSRVVIYSSDAVDADIAATADRAILKSRSSDKELIETIRDLVW